jgi:CRISPR/Cas system CMR subunit Cmr6 (Cas7 group RAMP superfamily)
VSGKIYSAHYLRLRDAWRLGVLAKAEDMAGGVMENAGLCLDRFGMPYIPGNGVKGCARRMAIQELLEARAKASDDELAKLLADIALVFGWGEEDWTSGSIKQGRIKSDFV